MFGLFRKKDVQVLCGDIGADYTKCFEYFIKREFNRRVKWVTSEGNSLAKGKYLLLFDVKTRIPEDFQFNLKKIGLEDGKLDHNILAVAMHRSESRKDDNAFEFMDTSDLDQSNKFAVLYYSGILMCDKSNRYAQETIRTFLSKK